MAEKPSSSAPGPLATDITKPRITPQQAKYRAKIEEALVKGNLTVVVGAGVSISAMQASKRMSGDDLARVTESMSWLGVLRHGLDYLEEEDLPLNEADKSELDAYKRMLEGKSLRTVDILQAASFLKRKLVDFGQLDNWFDLEFEGIYERCINHDSNPILDAIRELYHSGARIITTNYDDLLDKHLGVTTIVSDGTPALKRFFRKSDKGICHVHGVWWHSKGTVLDTMDYQRTVQDESLQQDLKNSMSSSEVLLFVGTGAGLDDPNFGRLLAWAAKQNDGLPQRHCILARHGESMDTKSNGLNVLRYGVEFEDLPAFIMELAQKCKPTPAPKHHYLVPSNQVAHFIGREDILTSIESSFALSKKRSHPVTLILHAMGGQGKTQVALELCRRCKPDCRAILWINATSETTAGRDIEIIASRLNTPLKRTFDDVPSKVEFVKETLENWNEPWMMIFDNYDSPTGFENIKDFMPSRGKGSILITSRDRGVGRLGRLILLPPMTDDEGLQLLTGKRYEDETRPDHREALNVVERLGHLPLAISQASSYLEHEKISPVQFLERYEAERKRVMKHIPKQFWEYKKIDVETEKEKAFSVFTTWEMSFQRIQTLGDQYKVGISHFLTVCAFLEPSKIGDHLFIRYQEENISTPSWIQLFISDHIEGSSNEEMSDDELLEDDTFKNKTYSKEEESPSRPSSDQISRIIENHKAATWSLESYWDIMMDLEGISLLKSVYRGSLGGVFIALHPLIRDWLQLRITKRERRPYIEEVRDVLHTNIINAPSTVEHNRELLSHIETYISYDERFYQSDSTLEYEKIDGPADDFRHFYHAQGRYRHAKRICTDILKKREEYFGAESLFTISAMSNLARTYADMGETIRARDLEEQVLELRKRVSGEEHPDTILAMGNLAGTYADMGKTIRARDLEEQVLELRKRVSGEEHPSTILAMGNLARTYADMGETIRARDLKEQVLELRKRVSGEEHPDTIVAMGNLARTYADIGDTIRARDLNEQVLELRKRVSGEEHPSTILAMGNLASTYADMGDTIRARDLEEQVLELRKRVSGEEHPDTILAMGNLASTYADMGETIRARELQEQVLELRKRVSGKEHPSTILAMGNLARIYADMGDTIRARELQEQVLELRKRVSGEEHPSTILAMGNLARTYADMGDTIRARDLEEQVLELRKRVSGEEHPDTILAMSNLASTYAEMGESIRARELQEQVLELGKRVSGEEHPSTTLAMAT